LLTAFWVLLYPDKRAKRQTPEQEVNRTPAMLWFEMLRYRSTWGIALGQLGYLYAFFFFVAWLPTYLVQERGMTILRSGFYTGLPFLGGFSGPLAGGCVGDFFTQGGVSPTGPRRAIIGFGFSFSTAMRGAAAYAPQVWLAVTLLTLCVPALRLATGSVNSLP